MSDSRSSAMDWDTYWRGSGDRAAFAGEGVEHPVVTDFWQRTLSSYRLDGTRLRLLDVASGNGAVIESVQLVFGDDALSITCLDSSASAIASLVARYPFVEGIIGDAREMPLPDQSFDIATSQFGVEYAGIEAINDMARLVAPGGSILLLMHVVGGMIDRECENNFNSIKELRDIEFIPAAKKIFAEARKCLQSEDPENTRAEFDKAVAAMRPIFPEFKAILTRYGDATGGGTLLTLYREVDRIHSRIMHHDLDEVLTWLQTMDDELAAYSGRMESMRLSAVDHDEYKRITDRLQGKGFDLNATEQLLDSKTKAPVAWTLIATRRQNAE